MNKNTIKHYLGGLSLISMMSFGLLMSPLSADAVADNITNKDTNIIVDEPVDAKQLQAAIEAFGVSTNQAEQAASASVSIINDQQKPSKKHRELADLPDDFADMNPY
jgi:hypothetical protein